jgi:hypothetical protein
MINKTDCVLDTNRQVLQIIAWFSRVLTCYLVYLADTDPSKDYLNLRQAGPEPEPIAGWSTSRLYFSASLALELFVSPLLTSKEFYRRVSLPERRF